MAHREVGGKIGPSSNILCPYQTKQRQIIRLCPCSQFIHNEIVGDF